MIVIKTRQPDPELEQKIRMLLEREHIEAEQISIASWEKLVLPGLTLDGMTHDCLLYTSPSPRDGLLSRMPSSA